MKIMKLLAGVSLLLLATSCAQKSSGWGQSPCELDDSQIGQVVSVSGFVEFIDSSLPGIYYADLGVGNCRVGITTNATALHNWQIDPAAVFVVGADITVTGMLFEVPLPDRPDELQLLVELRIAPDIHREGDPAANEQHQPEGELCQVAGEIGRSVTVNGEVSYVDGNAAAGVYAEVQADSGCFYKLWVERRFWDGWSVEQQDLLTEGNELSVEGLLTVVLGEQTIDIEIPPTDLSQ